MTIADELREHIAAYYLNGTPEGARLQAILKRVEALEANPHLEPDGSTYWDEARPPRELLTAFLARLERTAALSCPAADLTAAIDATLNSQEIP